MITWRHEDAPGEAPKLLHQEVASVQRHPVVFIEVAPDRDDVTLPLDSEVDDATQRVSQLPPPFVRFGRCHAEAGEGAVEVQIREM